MRKIDDRFRNESASDHERIPGKTKSKYKNALEIPSDLIEGIRQGREDAYNRLYLHFADPLMEFVMCYRIGREDAEEIVQDTFTYIWAKKDSLDPARNIKGLLYTCAKNYCLDYFRKKQVIRKYLSLPDSERNDELPVDEDYIARETRLLIEAVVERMPPVRKRVFLMNNHDGLTATQIAAALGIREQVVRRHVASAKKDIEKAIVSILFFLIP